MEHELPSELEVLDPNPGIDINYTRPQTLASWNNESVRSFGREAQATYLLTHVLESMKIGDPKARHEALSNIDADLQQFLSFVMKQVGGSWGFCCGAVATFIK